MIIQSIGMRLRVITQQNENGIQLLFELVPTRNAIASMQSLCSLHLFHKMYFNVKKTTPLGDKILYSHYRSAC